MLEVTFNIGFSLIERVWRRRFVCALLLSLLLHAGLLAILCIPYEGKRAMQNTQPHSQKRVLTVELLQPKPAVLQLSGVVEEKAQQFRQLEESVPRRQGGTKPAKHEVVPNVALKQMKMPVTEPTIPSEHEYFEAGDLDQSATPVGEWYVLAEHWPSDVARIELRVWISASGTLERWMVLSPQDNPKVEASLEYLGRTILNPAQRNGQPVASVMDVELLWAIE